MNGFALQKQGETGGTEVNRPTLEDRFLKLKEVQNFLGVSRSTLWRWQAEHGLRVVRIGGVTRIRESDLHAFLARHETAERIDPSVSRNPDFQSVQSEK